MSKYIPVEPEKWGEMVRALSENTSLKADIDRLRSRYAEAMDEMRHLKAEVERLRKAGDAMALNLYIPIRHEIYNELLTEWYAAKEGKQS